MSWPKMGSDSTQVSCAPALRHFVVPSVRQVGRDDWDRLCGDMLEGRDFFCTLEESALPGLELFYICIYIDDRVQLIAPAFSHDLDLAIGAPRSTVAALRLVRKFYQRFLIQRTLFCGSPFGEHGIIGCSTDPADQPLLLLELVRAMRQLGEQKRLGFILFKDFPEAPDDSLNLLEKIGFFKGESFPNVVVALPYRTMDSYLASLSYACRKDLRRKLRKAVSTAAIEVREVQSVADIIESVYALYLQTYQAGTVRFEKLTREYFLAVSRQMPDKVKFFLFYADGKLVCFNLCFRYGARLIDKFIGFDYLVSRRLNLYFYTWYHNVKWCIDHQVGEYQVGQTDHDLKIRLGGKFLPLSFYAKHNNPVLNAVLKSVARVLAPLPPKSAIGQHLILPHDN